MNVRMRGEWGIAAAVVAALGVLPLPAAAADPYIAGLHPQERPANAPVITSVTHDKAWRKRALHGITKPYPESLRFLDDQGDWYTPFVAPGMTGRFDMRAWHSAPPAPE